MRKLTECETAFAVFLLCTATAIASHAQTFTTVANFNGTNGAAPYYVTLIQGTDGHLYGAISPANIGGLVRALMRMTKETGRWDWTDRVYFLRRHR